MKPDLIYLTIPGPDHPFKIREISSDDFNQYKNDGELITGFDYYLRRLREIELNRDAYFAIKQFYTSLLKENDTTPVDFDFKKDGFVDLNRCFNNFIASFKSLIEHCENKMIEVFGRESEQFTSFKAKLSKIYDGDLTYRLLYNLRNFSVHKSFPIEYVNFDRISFTPYGFGYWYELGVFFSKTKFLESATLSRKMGDFMDQFDDRVKVCIFINKIIPLIYEITHQFVNILKPEFEVAIDRIIKLSNDHDQLKLGLTKTSIKDGRILYNTILIPVDIAFDLHRLLLE